MREKKNTMNFAQPNRTLKLFGISHMLSQKQSAYKTDNMLQKCTESPKFHH